MITVTTQQSMQIRIKSRRDKGNAALDGKESVIDFEIVYFINSKLSLGTSRCVASLNRAYCRGLTCLLHVKIVLKRISDHIDEQKKRSVFWAKDQFSTPFIVNFRDYSAWVVSFRKLLCLWKRFLLWKVIRKFEGTRKRERTAETTPREIIQEFNVEWQNY